MNGFMLAGVITGIVVGLALAAVAMTWTKKNRGEKFTYDERQKVARGEGYKYAFYVLLIYLAGNACLEMALDKPWAEPMAAAMVGIAVAVLVHVIYCIWNECYFSMNEEPKKVLIFFGVISVINVIIAVMQGLEGELIENGTLTNQCANLVVAIMFGFIMIALAIKNATRKEEED